MTACVRTPKRDSYGETACKTLLNNPGLTLDELIAIHGNLGPMRSDTLGVYKKSMQYDFIFEKFNKYYLAPHLHAHIKKLVDGDSKKPKLQLVAPKYHKPFTEMKPIARPAGVRDIYFKTVGGV